MSVTIQADQNETELKLVVQKEKMACLYYSASLYKKG
jgi:hypothetical protein